MMSLARRPDAAPLEGTSPASEHEQRLSPGSWMMLRAGIESACTRPFVDRGSFAQYATDENDTVE